MMSGHNRKWSSKLTHYFAQCPSTIIATICLLREWTDGKVPAITKGEGFFRRWNGAKRTTSVGRTRGHTPSHIYTHTYAHMQWSVFVLCPPCVIFEVSIKPLNAAINQLHSDLRLSARRVSRQRD